MSKRMYWLVGGLILFVIVGTILVGKMLTSEGQDIYVPATPPPSNTESPSATSRPTPTKPGQVTKPTPTPSGSSGGLGPVIDVNPTKRPTSSPAEDIIPGATAVPIPTEPIKVDDLVVDVNNDYEIHKQPNGDFTVTILDIPLRIKTDTTGWVDGLVSTYEYFLNSGKQLTLDMNVLELEGYEDAYLDVNNYLCYVWSEGDEFIYIARSSNTYKAVFRVNGLSGSAKDESADELIKSITLLKEEGL